MKTLCVGRLWPATVAGMSAAFDTLQTLPSAIRRRARMLVLPSQRAPYLRLGLCVLAETPLPDPDAPLEPTTFEWDGGPQS